MCFIALEHLQLGPLYDTFFVNDSVVFCSANEDEAKGIVNALDSNAEVSGQVINKEKSSLCFGSSAPRREKKNLETLEH